MTDSQSTLLVAMEKVDELLVQMHAFAIKSAKTQKEDRVHAAIQYAQTLRDEIVRNSQPPDCYTFRLGYLCGYMATIITDDTNVRFPYI